MTRLLPSGHIGGPQIFSSAAVFTGLLDTYPNAAFAYSLRKLSRTYAGSAIRLRRVSDDAEADIGFDSDGDFDLTAALAHISGSTGTVVTWYDQSGQGLDVTQATEAEQPPFVAISPVNGNPALFFDADGGDHNLSRASVNGTTHLGAAGNNFAMSSVYDQISQSSRFIYSWGATELNFNPSWSDGRIYLDYGSNLANGSLDGPAPNALPHITDGYRDTGNLQEIIVDGTSVAGPSSETATLATGDNTLYIGRQVGGSYFDGYLLEVIFWKADIGA